MTRQIMAMLLVAAIIILGLLIVLTAIDMAETHHAASPSSEPVADLSSTHAVPLHVSRAARPTPTPSPVKVKPTTPKPTPRPKPVPRRSTAIRWDRIAQCESGNHWNHHTATHGLYWGGLQMTLGFWKTYGGLAYALRPDLATKSQQIAVAERAYKSRGLQPWPTCGALG